MKYLKQRKNGIFYYQRRVPKDLIKLLGKEHEMITLGTRDKRIAVQKLGSVDKAVEKKWRDMRVLGVKGDEKKYQEAVQIAKLYGFDYMEAPEIEAKGVDEIVDRILALEGNENKHRQVDAVLGAEEKPKLMLSECFEIYEECVKTNNARKSPEQYRKWRNTKIWGMNAFISVVGNIDLNTLKRTHILDFRSNSAEKIMNGEITRKSANKQIAQVRTILRTIDDNKALNLGIGLLFSNINFDVAPDPDEGKKSYPVAFIRDRLMNLSNYDTLNKEATLAIFAMANTGLRLTEICGFLPKDLHLDAPIPYISIVAQDQRELKTRQSRREIPLVGASLWAFQQLDHGYFRDYYDRNSALSSLINQYLRNNDLQPEAGLSLNSLRHSFEDRLTDLEPEERVKVDLMGHKMSRAKYGDGPSLELKKKYIDQIAFDVKVTL